jgi:hypothetical protein
MVLGSVLFIFGCAVGGAASQLVVPPASAAGTQRWDYFCFEEWGASEIMAKAQQAGAAGWEMVLADSLQARQSVCFKRPM